MKSRILLIGAGALTVGLGLSGCDNLSDKNEGQKPKPELKKAELSDAEQKVLNATDKNLAVQTVDRVKPARQRIREKCEALMQDFWTKPHTWKSSSGLSHSLKTMEGGPSDNPVLKKLTEILPDDWTIVVSPENESGKAGEAIFSIKNMKPKTAEWLQKEVQLDDLPSGAKFFNNGIMIITPAFTVFAEPPNKTNTRWKRDKEIKGTSIRSGHGNIESGFHPENTNGDEQAKTDRYCGKILPFHIAALKLVHAGKPFWVPAKDHAEFNTHPDLNVLRHANGYLLVKF